MARSQPTYALTEKAAERCTRRTCGHARALHKPAAASAGAVCLGTMPLNQPGQLPCSCPEFTTDCMAPDPEDLTWGCVRHPDHVKNKTPHEGYIRSGPAAGRIISWEDVDPAEVSEPAINDLCPQCEHPWSNHSPTGCWADVVGPHPTVPHSDQVHQLCACRQERPRDVVDAEIVEGEPERCACGHVEDWHRRSLTVLGPNRPCRFGASCGCSDYRPPRRQGEPVMPTTTTDQPLPEQVRGWLRALVAAGEALPSAGDGSDPDSNEHFEVYQQALMADWLLSHAAFPGTDETVVVVRPGHIGKVFPATTSGDVELDAITAIVSLVQHLPPEVRSRVFAYLGRRWPPRGVSGG